jgi:uncharacterized protein (TIGR00730 family)
MKSILVYCGANVGTKPIYQTTAHDVGKIMAEKKIRLVYGAGSVGLMGIIANAILENGGEATGIIPNFLDRLEVGHKSLTEIHKVETMHERKALMEQICDGIIALPGGYGTLDELFEMLTWSQLGLHNKPIGLLNVDGFYDHIIAHLQKMVEDGFLKEDNRNILQIADNIEELFEKMENYKASYQAKWIS